jgi:two-component system, chemotaxis family, protein-glutamate methylesterase/glutaminase
VGSGRPGPGRATRLHRDIVAIGGSAGALEPLKRIIADLPADLSASVLTVLHLSPNAPSTLVPILNRVGGMQAVNPQDGDPLTPGFIYVANPDLHLEVTERFIRQSHGPRINGVRPAIDVLFESVAETFGPRAIGVVLSGGLDDGSAGLAALREAGGIGIVQQPDDAAIASMPRNAMQRAAPEYVLVTEEIGPRIVTLVNDEVEMKGRHGTDPKTQIKDAVAGDDVDGELSSPASRVRSAIAPSG